jgi:hypothetical protein
VGGLLIGPELDVTERAAPPCTALLLAVALLLGAVWFRGGLVSDTFRLKAGGDVTLHAFSGQGSVAVALTEGGEFFKDKAAWWAYSESRPPIDFYARWTNLGDETQFSGAGFVVIREPSRGTIFGVLVPCMPLAPAVAAFAVARLAYWRLYARRRARVLAGLCPDCGHDMHALSERCSNCGRPRVRGGFRVGRVRNEPSSSSRRAA